MEDRYWVTGVQVGLLLVADFLTKEQRLELVNEIQDKQYLGTKDELTTMFYKKKKIVMEKKK